MVAPETSAALRAIADPMRARILQLLAIEQQCTCHLQDALGAKQTLITHHLTALREVGLVCSARSGRFTYYRLVPGAFDAAAEFLDGLRDASHRDLPQRPCP